MWRWLKGIWKTAEDLERLVEFERVNAELREALAKRDQDCIQLTRRALEDELDNREWREKVYARTPAIVSEVGQKRVNVERLLVLAGLAEDDPLWMTVLGYADEHARNELQMALRPGLSDGDRQFNAGRASGAEDFASALRDLRLKAETEARTKRPRD